MSPLWNIDLFAYITLFEEEIYDYLFLFFLFLAAITFPLLLVVDAPYGKLFSSSWGPTVRTDIGWIIQEAPAFFLFLWFALKGSSRLKEPSYMLLSSMFLGHYLQRAFIFPLLMKTPGKPTSLIVVLSAFGWNVINGYLVGRGLFHFEAKLSRDWYQSPIFIAGALCWLCGFVINLHSDHILRNLRKPGEKGYKIPHGGLFRWVSCANYFGEMVEWSGWALASQSLAGALFVFWTVANLLPRAIRYHQWYIQKFSSYVTLNRKACIPFLI
ncbi:hypothetical protein GpartN1_g5343.t1 [Galdieria partita]|uniref:3-oxo-5-alpha-steroid 4-dehydrogenase 1 n=1 Tax=Galdieria partita TaxID=83374 RepID=A0A9C7USE1_9RHOD|nr:hypothetical protein GpartN1_g5343.t1 [Galdieria partita]